MTLACAQKCQPARQDHFELVFLDGFEDFTADRLGSHEQLSGRFGLAVAEIAIEVGLHRARTDHRNFDSQRFQLVIKALRPAVHRELGAAVGRHVERADFSCNGRDIDDVAGPLAIMDGNASCAQ